jgi:hypothetical protein
MVESYLDSNSFFCSSDLYSRTSRIAVRAVGFDDFGPRLLQVPEKPNLYPSKMALTTVCIRELNHIFVVVSSSNPRNLL